MKVLRLLPYFITLLLLGCSASPVNLQASADPGGIGGTGVIQQDHSGIGGTGKSVDEGIGGTGRVAQTGDGGSGIGGTGIVGTITAFGSIWVNDAHVHFDENTPITINQAPATSGELQLGQVVAVNSIPDGNAFQAKSIDIIHEVVGPIETLKLNEQRLAVLKQDIVIDDSTVLFNVAEQAEFKSEMLVAGAFIEVSGLRQSDGDIVASRIDVIAPPEQLQLIGELEQNAEGAWQIDDQIVEIDELLMPDAFDKRVLLSGQLEGDQFIVEALNLDSIETVLEDASELIYEGYFYEEDMEGFVTIGGLNFAVDNVIELTGDYDFDEPLRVNASLSEDGLYEADDLMIELEHEDYYIDLIPEHEEFDDEGVWIEEDYFEDPHHDEHEFSHEDHGEYDDHEEFEDEYFYEDEYEEDFEEYEYFEE